MLSLQRTVSHTAELPAAELLQRSPRSHGGRLGSRQILRQQPNPQRPLHSKDVTQSVTSSQVRSSSHSSPSNPTSSAAHDQGLKDDEKSNQRTSKAHTIPFARLCNLLALAACLAILISGPVRASEAGFSPSRALKGLLSFVLHLDVHLGQIIARYGNATYAILFGIVFCETGLVITPFLPGDSLLFAAGAFASLGHLNVLALLATFVSSAILGDFVNYQLGHYFGNKAKDSRLVKKEYLERTETFYEKYGGKTVVLARFIPIVRTFAPFVAGVGAMSFQKFSLYNIGGAILWSLLFVGAGAFLGNIPAVKHNFSIVIFAIIGISVLPVLFEAIAARREVKAVGADPRDPKSSPTG